ncbi:hypothetical protein V2J09_013652 [Rumex salicifolius]
MENTSSRVSKSLPFVGMIVLNFAMIGSSTLIKAAMTSGLSQYVYVVYYDALGTFILLPLFVHHCLTRKRLPITFSLLCRFFILSLTGRCLFPIRIYTGLNYTSVTVTSALGNLTPIFTYVIAVCLRIERLDLSRSSDQFKTVGTFVSVLGAIVADTAKLYPDEVTIVFFCNLFGTLQTAAAAFFLVDSQTAWKINHKIEIIAIVYAKFGSAIFVLFDTLVLQAFSISVATNTVITWCLRKKGALFVSMFDPLSVAIAAFMGFAFLRDGIYLGSVVGSTIIAVGFYAVMWGQARTTSAMANKIGGLETGSSQVVAPLLCSNDALGTLFLFPWLLCHWIGGKRLPISSSFLCRLFFLSLIGKCLFPICTFTGLKYSSISVAAAITNLIPVFTFILAVTFRMEKLDLRKFNDQIRTFGAILAVIGALVVSLYKGPTLLKPQGSSSSNSAQLLLIEQSNWLIGCLIYTVGILFRSSWNILQADTVKSYPDEVAIVFFYTFFGTIQVAAASFFFVESQSEWQLHSKIEVIVIFYAGFAVSIFNSTAITWCLHIKGPIYVSMFSPLGVGIAAVFGPIYVSMFSPIALLSHPLHSCIRYPLTHSFYPWTSIAETFEPNYSSIFHWQYEPNFHFSVCNFSEDGEIKAFGILVAVLGAFVKLISEQPNWLLGCILITVGFVLRAIWNIFQADTAKLYPDEVTIVFFSNLLGTIQTAIASFFLVKGLNAWNLDSKNKIIAVVFSAVSLSVLNGTIVTWCLRKKGPVFVSMFDPLNVALSTFTGFVFLTDGIYLGSVIGSSAIIVGLYAVLWGQSKTTSAMAKKIGANTFTWYTIKHLAPSSSYHGVARLQFCYKLDVTAKIYPDEVTIVFFCNLFGTIQSVILYFFLVKGTIISTLLTWCLRKKGLVFVSMFDPLNVTLAAFMGFGQAKTTKMIVSMAMDNKIGGLESGSSTSHVTPLCCTAQVIETLLISSEKMTCRKVN